jgi:hypothetical protein
MRARGLITTWLSSSERPGIHYGLLQAVLLYSIRIVGYEQPSPVNKLRAVL